VKILVTGGAGYVGSSLVPRLLERGYEVDVVDVLWFGEHLPKAVRVRKGDVFDLEEDDLRGYEQVIFLAGLSNDPMAEFSPSLNFVSNAAAPAYLAYTARRAGVKRYIFASTCSVYGYRMDELCDEEAPAASSYPYGISKLQGERAVMQMAGDDFSVICLRKGTVCGYSPRMRLDLVVNTMFRTAMEEGRITVFNPEIWRPILSIQDAVSAYVRAVESNYAVSGVFNVASGNYTVGEIADVVHDILETELDIKADVRIEHRQDCRSYKVSFEKAMRVLSFKPKHDIEFIVEDLISHREKFSDYHNPAYYNIETFRRLFPKGR